MIQFFKKKKTHAEIINNAYKELLNREPDEIGFNHYMTLFEKMVMKDINKQHRTIGVNVILLKQSITELIKSSKIFTVIAIILKTSHQDIRVLHRHS